MASSEDMEKVTFAMNSVSIQVVEEGDFKKKKIDRHCAFCLTLIPGEEEVKLCGGCKRRAYCSKECETADWAQPMDKPAFNGKIHGYGQGHKNWCGLDYGEEDLDWKVAPISGNGKGLGLVALRDLPPLCRIMVEGMQCEPGLKGTYHPGMDDLAPAIYSNEYCGCGCGNWYPDRNSVMAKFHINAIGTPFGSKVGLRFSRANHSCDPNAFGIVDHSHVMILCSTREIKEGEEISFAYLTAINGVGREVKEEYEGKSPEFFRNLLFRKWGITCPPSCRCRDEEHFKMLTMARELYAECERDYNWKNVLPKMEQVIEIAGDVGCSVGNIGALYHRAFQFAIKSQASLEKVNEYLGMAIKCHKATYHPDNETQVKELEDTLEELND